MNIPSPTSRNTLMRKEPYKRFVENKLREHFDFEGVPVQVYFRQK
nr:hypothetical protein [Parapedobacter luteus]